MRPVFQPAHVSRRKLRSRFHNSLHYQVELLEDRVLLDATEIEIGQSVIESINSDAEVDSWTFEGELNQEVSINGTGDVNVSLFDTSNQLVADAITVSGTFDTGTVTLASAGTYRIDVSANTVPANYTLNLTPIVTIPINVGDLIIDQLTTPQHVFEYQFDTTADQILLIDFRDIAGASITTSLTTPTSTILQTESSSSANPHDYGPLAFTESGTHTLQIKSDSATTAPSFEFQLVGVESHFEVGEVVSSSISVPNEVDLHTFFGAAGQRIYFDKQQGSQLTLDWSLIDPTGVTVFSTSFLDRDVVTLGESGNYVILIEHDGTGTPTYQFQLFNVPPISSTPINLDEVVSGSIDVPGESDRFTFSVLPGQRVYFDKQQGSQLVFDWSVNDESGATVFSRSFLDRDTIVLTGGNYTIEMDGVGEGTGAYAFEVIRVPEPIVQPIGINEVVSGSIDIIGETDIYDSTLLVGNGYGSIQFRVRSIRLRGA